MGIPLDQIKDPRTRARVEQALAASGSAASPAPGPALQAADCKRLRAQSEAGVAPSARRIQQQSRLRSNRLETDFGNKLRWEHPNAPIYEQAITFLLANGVRYTPDWVMEHHNGMICYEVKGRKAWDDAIVKVKVAASVYPRFKWVLVWKEAGIWKDQEVLP